jgi:hypothetical protein
MNTELTCNGIVISPEQDEIPALIRSSPGGQSQMSAVQRASAGDSVLKRFLWLYGLYSLL